MGSDGDDDVFSLVEFRGQSWHRISTTTTEYTTSTSTELDGLCYTLNVFFIYSFKDSGSINTGLTSINQSIVHCSTPNTAAMGIWGS